jgi:DNA-binding NarL/FixJ family response regulator
MPHLTGDKLSEALIAIRPGIPIVLCTGFSDSVTETQALSLGVRAFVMKPVAMEQIATILRSVLEGPCKAVDEIDTQIAVN